MERRNAGRRARTESRSGHVAVARRPSASFLSTLMPLAVRSTNMPDNVLPYVTLRPMFEELRGQRVLLRPYTLADAEARHAANAESRDHLRPWEPEQADAFHTLDETRDWIVRASANWLLRKRFSMGLWHIEHQR